MSSESSFRKGLEYASMVCNSLGRIVIGGSWFECESQVAEGSGDSQWTSTGSSQYGKQWIKQILWTKIL